MPNQEAATGRRCTWCRSVREKGGTDVQVDVPADGALGAGQCEGGAVQMYRSMYRQTMKSAREEGCTGQCYTGRCNAMCYAKEDMGGWNVACG